MLQLSNPNVEGHTSYTSWSVLLRGTLFGSCEARAMQVQCLRKVQHNMTQHDTTWHKVTCLAFFEGFGQGGSQLSSAEEFWMGPRTSDCYTLRQSLHETYFLCPFIVHSLSMRRSHCSFINFGSRLNRGPAQLLPSSWNLQKPPKTIQNSESQSKAQRFSCLTCADQPVETILPQESMQLCLPILWTVGVVGSPCGLWVFVVLLCFSSSC